MAISLSLFDGISCGRVAMERAGIPVMRYYASEIDKHAIHVSKKNYPDTIHLGDVRAVRQMVDYDLLGHVDYLIGGSPCQGFSMAGKQLAFNDPRSVLFFDFVHILNTLRKRNPNIKFLLENVSMKKEYLDIISFYLGVQPIKINSALLSAQNRVRYYWCNWEVQQPADRGLVLRDILCDTFTDAEVCDQGQINRLENSNDIPKMFSKIDPLKAGAMTARQYSNWKGMFVTVPTDNRIAGWSKTKDGLRPYKNDGRKGSLNEYGTIRFKHVKSACVTSANAPKILESETPLLIRKLSPIECERLQTLPDNYTAGISNSQRYKALGNGWTVDVIAHILKGSVRNV